METSLPLRAISIRQPWAWLIIHGGKDIENRSWPTKFRGPVLIHAAKAWGRAEKESREDVLNYFGIETPDHPDLGGIIGQVEIVDCVTTQTSRWHDGYCYGFVLRNPKPLPFIPCRGALGFFKPEVAR